MVNDCTVTVGVLAKLGDLLVDIQGQHDHQALLNPEIHVDLLDLYGKTMDERNELTKKYYGTITKFFPPHIVVYGYIPIYDKTTN